MNNMQGNHYQQRSQQNQFRGGSSNDDINMHSNANVQFLNGQSSAVDSRGTTTRIVFTNGNVERSVRYGDLENGRCCELSGTTNGLGETTGNFQFNHYKYGRPFRQQQTSNFRSEGYVPRNYKHPQGNQNQGRFVKIQGGKFKPLGGGYWQCQTHKKQSRGRFNPNYSNFNSFRRNFDMNSDSIEIQKDVKDFIAQQQQQQELFENDGNQNRDRLVEGRFSPENLSASTTTSSSTKSSGKGRGKDNNADAESRVTLDKKGSGSGSKYAVNKRLLHLKTDFSPNSKTSSHNLSYEDITENSDENEDNVSDFRESLLWKKHCKQFVKREPGEIYSDEDENPEDEKPVKKVKLERKSSDNYDVSPKPGPSSNGDRCENSSAKSRKETKKEEKRGGVEKRSTSICAEDSKTKKKAGVNGQPIPHQRSHYLQYSYHDDRCQEKQTSTVSKGSRLPAEDDKKKESCNSSYDSSDSSKKFYEAESKEKFEKMKRALRETRDKLLESRVVSSKKVLRFKQEIDHLNVRLADATKKEIDLKSALKVVENELATKRLELAKMTTLHDVELREKEKFRSDLTRTYQDRLTIEIDKLRALFDIELAKMQAFYLAQNFCFEDASSMSCMMKGTSECVVRNPEQRDSSKIGMNKEGLQPNNNVRAETDFKSTSLASSSGVPLMQTYFDYQSAVPSAPCTSTNAYQNGLFKFRSSSNTRSHCSTASSLTMTDSSDGRAIIGVENGYGHGHPMLSSEPTTSMKMNESCL